MENLDKQKEKYKDILKQNKKDINSILILARIAIKELKIAVAVEYYKNVLEIDYLNTEALFVLAAFNMKKGNLSNAIKMFKTIEESGIENNFVYEYLGFLENDNTKKEKYFLKALSLYREETIAQKEYIRLLYNSKQLYNLSFYSLALQYINLAQSFKKNWYLSNLAGCIHFNMKDYDKALSFFHDASTKLSQNNARVLANIALCYKEKGSNKMAVKYIEKSKAVSDKDKLIYFIEALIYVSENDKKSAVKALEKALEIDSDYEEARNILNGLI